MGRRSNMGISHNEGPAEAATSPRHGPTTLEETAMDKPMKNTAAPRRASDAFHDFASGVDVNLRSTRAKRCAVHTLLENGRDPGEEVMDARGRLFDGKIEVDLSRCKPKAAVASEDIDERAACRALDLDGWVARRRAGCRIKGAARRRPKKTVRLYQPTEAPPQSAREADGTKLELREVRTDVEAVSTIRVRCRPGSFEWRYSRSSSNQFHAGCECARAWERAGITLASRLLGDVKIGGGGWRGRSPAGQYSTLSRA